MIQLPSGDSVVAITPKQMRGLTLLMIEHDKQKELLKADQSQLGTYKVAVMQRDSLIGINTVQLTIQESRINDCNGTLKLVKDELEKAAKKIRWLKFERALLGTAVIAETIVLIIVM